MAGAAVDVVRPDVDEPEPEHEAEQGQTQRDREGPGPLEPVERRHAEQHREPGEQVDERLDEPVAPLRVDVAATDRGHQRGVPPGEPLVDEDEDADPHRAGQRDPRDRLEDVGDPVRPRAAGELEARERVAGDGEQHVGATADLERRRRG